MITERELQALISILQRAPLTPAEAIAIEAIIEKLKPQSAP